MLVDTTASLPISVLPFQKKQKKKKVGVGGLGGT